MKAQLQAQDGKDMTKKQTGNFSFKTLLFQSHCAISVITHLLTAASNTTTTTKGASMIWQQN